MAEHRAVRATGDHDGRGPPLLPQLPAPALGRGQRRPAARVAGAPAAVTRFADTWWADYTYRDLPPYYAPAY